MVLQLVQEIVAVLDFNKYMSVLIDQRIEFAADASVLFKLAVDNETLVLNLLISLLHHGPQFSKHQNCLCIISLGEILVLDDAVAMKRVSASEFFKPSQIHENIPEL